MEGPEIKAVMGQKGLLPYQQHPAGYYKIFTFYSE